MNEVVKKVLCLVAVAAFLALLTVTALLILVLAVDLAVDHIDSWRRIRRLRKDEKNQHTRGG